VYVGINNFSFVLFLHKLQYKHIGDRVHWMILHLYYSDMMRDYCSWRDSISGRGFERRIYCCSFCCFFVLILGGTKALLVDVIANTPTRNRRIFQLGMLELKSELI